MSEEPEARAAHAVIPAAAAPAASHCPWCSAEVADPAPERCPSCGARLVDDVAAEIPGVTAVDPAVLRAVAAAPVKRGMFGMGGPTRETPLAPEVASVVPTSLDALAPPSREVLEEMRRIREELDAAVAAQALVDAEAERVAVDEPVADEAGVQADGPAVTDGEGGAPIGGADAHGTDDRADGRTGGGPGVHDARPGGD